MEEQNTLFGDNAEYQAFVGKFKPKLTTDDCYTPPEVYEAVRKWACREYGIDPAAIVRPFYPGGDYEHFEYQDGCVVLDNPPFSIFSKILEFYLERGIAFFLFAPALTLFSGKNTCMRCCHIATNANITYENGATVLTGFVTSFDAGTVLRTAPELTKAVDAANKKRIKTMKKQLSKYQYPDYVVTAAIAKRYSKYGIEYRVRAEDCVRIAGLDEQKSLGKTIFGGGDCYCRNERRRNERRQRLGACRSGSGISFVALARSAKRRAAPWI